MNRGVASFDDNLGVKECERVWTCVGEGALESSRAGADIDIETGGTGTFRGGEEEGGGVVILIVGKG